MNELAAALNDNTAALRENRVGVPVSGGPETLKRTTPEMERALEWLRDNPDMQGLSLRQAATKAKVSYSTLNRARKIQ